MPKKKTAKKAPDKQLKNKSNLRVVSKPTQWKPGQSGNPAGRPRKEDCLTSLMRKEIEKIDPEDQQKRTHKETLVLATLKLAKSGNAAALRECWERLDGKITDRLEVESKDSLNAILLAKTLSRKELEELNERLERTANA